MRIDHKQSLYQNMDPLIGDVVHTRFPLSFWNVCVASLFPFILDSFLILKQTRRILALKPVLYLSHVAVCMLTLSQASHSFGFTMTFEHLKQQPFWLMFCFKNIGCGDSFAEQKLWSYRKSWNGYSDCWSHTLSYIYIYILYGNIVR